MENQTCLVEEYIVQQPSKFEVTVKGIEDIKYVENIKEVSNGAYLFNGLSENMIAVVKPNQERRKNIYHWSGKKDLSLEWEERFGRVPPITIVCAKYINGDIKQTDKGFTSEIHPKSKIEFDRHAFWE
ncbi:unnamed protein product [Brassica oleracea]